MTEEKIENWEEEAWEDIAKANEETQKNLKDNEALFDGIRRRNNRRLYRKIRR